MYKNISLAPVVQRTGHWVADLEIEVRFFAGAPIIFYSSRSLMDKMLASEACDAGSIPVESTPIKKLCKIAKFFDAMKYFLVIHRFFIFDKAFIKKYNRVIY